MTSNNSRDIFYSDSSHQIHLDDFVPSHLKWIKESFLPIYFYHMDKRTNQILLKSDHRLNVFYFPCHWAKFKSSKMQ